MPPRLLDLLLLFRAGTARHGDFRFALYPNPYANAGLLEEAYSGCD
jgi:hypothetical protein